jgi:hypothetical protein
MGYCDLVCRCGPRIEYFMSFATETALIVDDDEFFRMALRTVVTGTLGFSEVLEAENFDQATALPIWRCLI